MADSSELSFAPERTLRVVNLPKTTTAHLLEVFFEHAGCGVPSKIYLLEDQNCALVEFQTAERATFAAGLSGCEFFDAELRLEPVGPDGPRVLKRRPVSPTLPPQAPPKPAPEQPSNITNIRNMAYVTSFILLLLSILEASLYLADKKTIPMLPPQSYDYAGAAGLVCLGGVIAICALAGALSGDKRLICTYGTAIVLSLILQLAMLIFLGTVVTKPYCYPFFAAEECDWLDLPHSAQQRHSLKIPLFVLLCCLEAVFFLFATLALYAAVRLYYVPSAYSPIPSSDMDAKLPASQGSSRL